MIYSREYTEYLASEHWAELRITALNRANRKCEVCSSVKSLVGHHLLYRTPLTDGIPEDIMALCTPCHDTWHEWIRSTGQALKSFTHEATRGALLVILNTPKKKPATVRLAVPGAALKPRIKKASKAMRAAKREARIEDIRSALLSDAEVASAIKTMGGHTFKKFIRARTPFGSKNRSRIISTAMQLFAGRASLVKSDSGRK